MPAKAGPNQGRLLAAVATICRAGSFFRSLFTRAARSPTVNGFYRLRKNSIWPLFGRARLLGRARLRACPERSL